MYLRAMNVQFLFFFFRSHNIVHICRYFLLVVAVYAHTKNKEFLVCGNVSERIIVRVSLKL